MTPAPIRCPHCGSYDMEWLSDVEVRCLDCGRVSRFPPGLTRIARREAGLRDEGNGDDHALSWDGVREVLEE